MKKRLAGLLFLLCLSVFGYSLLNNELTAKGRKVQNTPIEKAQKLTLDEAVTKAIAYHHNLKKDIFDNDFPTKIRIGQTISTKIKIGGPSGNITKLDMSIEAQKDGNHYFITLIKNYNVTVNGREARSIWTYNVSDNGVKMIDKKEYGNLVNTIK
jgi:hypothetical protein